MTFLLSDAKVFDMTIENSTTACAACGAFSKSTARFCSECGKRLGQNASPLSVQAVGLVLLTATVLWVAAWTTQRSLLGTKPTQTFTASANGTGAGDANTHASLDQLEVASDPEIEKLVKEVAGLIKEPAKLEPIAAALVQRYSALPNPSKAIALELVNSFSAILKADPKNASALVGMADVSFDQQTFSKSVEFYERYLKIVPGEDRVRQRYAASLTFVGRIKDSISELDKLIKKDPTNFSANAYLAIAYAQDGQKDRAIEIGDKAISFAPSDEAKERFALFLDQVKGKDTASPDAANVRGNMPPKTAESSGATSTQGGVEAIEAAIKQSPIAASKFSKSEKKSDGTLVLYFNEFPMAQMPPFAKDKFLGRFREVGANAGDIKKLSFVDAATGKEMESFSLSPAK